MSATAPSPTASPATTAPVLAVDELAVHYGQRSALAGITLDIPAGTTVSLLGPNGAGKSTLLKVLAGMLPASHGSVRLNGQPITRPHPAITYVPQRSGADWTFPVTVLEAVLMGIARDTPRWRPFGVAERRHAQNALDTVGMAHLSDVQIGALSGGQQQRVFLARALLSCGEVLLLDEPFTGVDIPTQELFVALFDRLKERNVTVVYATHDLAQAARTSDTVVLLNRTIIAEGPPKTVMTREHLRATFGGQVIVIDGAGPNGQERDRP